MFKMQTNKRFFKNFDSKGINCWVLIYCTICLNFNILPWLPLPWLSLPWLPLPWLLQFRYHNFSSSITMTSPIPLSWLLPFCYHDFSPSVTMTAPLPLPWLLPFRYLDFSPSVTMTSPIPFPYLSPSILRGCFSLTDSVKWSLPDLSSYSPFRPTHLKS